MERRKETNPLRREKLNKLKQLRSLRADPYPHVWRKPESISSSAAVRQKFAALQAGEMSGNGEVCIAGRLMRKRDMGKAAFFTVQDQPGQLQCYIKKEDFAAGPGKQTSGSSKRLAQQRTAARLAQQTSSAARLAQQTDSAARPAQQTSSAAPAASPWDIWRLSDIGDILGASGRIFRTRRGELSLRISDLKMLCKSLEPLPEKYHGLEEKELKYRHRHLDLIMDPKSRETLQTRAKIIREIRSFMEERGFIEADTPVLQPIYGGAEARPFETYFHRLNQKMYLKISPEIYLKKLLAGGFEKVYEIGKNFRNEGIDRSHSPEFLMLEYYEAYTDYECQMDQFEELVRRAASKIVFPKKAEPPASKAPQEVQPECRLKYQGRELDLSPPWLRMSLINHESLIVFRLSEEEEPAPGEPAPGGSGSEKAPAKFNYQGRELSAKNFWGQIIARFKEEKAKLRQGPPAPANKKALPHFDFSNFWKGLAAGAEAWESFRSCGLPPPPDLTAPPGKAPGRTASDSKGGGARPEPPLWKQTGSLLRCSRKLLRYARFLDPKGDFQKAERAIQKLSKLKTAAEPSDELLRELLEDLNSALDELSLAACERTAEKYFWDPVIITDFPLSGSPLTKSHRKSPRLVERFEPYMAGMEIGNAYTELNDPIEQRKRLESQKRLQGGGPGGGAGAAWESRPESLKPRPVDESFLKALEAGMPPAGGAGLGIERLVMILTDQPSIRDSMPFPALRTKP